MAIEKQIKISANLDTNGFDRQLKGLEDKMKTLQKSSTQRLSNTNSLKDDPIFGEQAQRAYDKYSKQNNDRFNSMFKQQQEMFKQRQNYISQIEKEIDATKRLEQVDEKRLKTLTQMLALENKKQAETMQVAGKIKGFMPETPQAMPSPELTPRPTETGGTSIMTLLKGIGAAAVIQGAVNASTKILQHRLDRDTKLLSDKASSTTIAADSLNDTLSGRGATNAYWSRERLRASTMANSRQSSVGTMDTVKAASSVGTQSAIGFGAGAAAGGMAGLMYGAPLGPAGMAAGLTVGSAIGGVMGGLGGAANSLGNERTYNRLLDQDAYKAMSSKEGMENYKGNLEAQKALNRPKSIAEEQYYDKMGQYTDIQRQTGLSDAQLYGAGSIKGGQREGTDALKFRANGALEEGMDRFSNQTLDRNYQQIRGAGGPSSMLMGGRAVAAQYERQFNLTNAGSALGQQGSVGLSTVQSEQNLKKVLTDAVAAGVNLTDMPSQLVKFTQTAVELATASGGFSESTSDKLSSAMVGTSNYDINSAKSAVENFNSKAGSTQGAQGQMGKGFLMRELKGKNVGAPGLQLLDSLSTQELESNPEIAQDIADKYFDGDVSKLMDTVSRKDAQKQNLYAGTDKAQKAYGEAIKGKSQSEINADPKLRAMRLASLTSKRYSENTEGKSLRDSQSENELTANVLAGNGAPGISADVQKQATGRKDNAATAFEGQQAVGDRANLGYLRDYMGELTKSAKSFNENTYLYNQTFEQFSKALNTGATGLDQFNKSLENILTTLNKNGYSNPVAPKR
jgi:hypothetical protein